MRQKYGRLLMDAMQFFDDPKRCITIQRFIKYCHVIRNMTMEQANKMAHRIVKHGVASGFVKLKRNYIFLSVNSDTNLRDYADQMPLSCSKIYERCYHKVRRRKREIPVPASTVSSQVDTMSLENLPVCPLTAEDFSDLGKFYEVHQSKTAPEIYQRGRYKKEKPTPKLSTAKRRRHSSRIEEKKATAYAEKN